MMDLDRLRVIRFDTPELVGILADEKFSHARAQKWMLNHEAFAWQVVMLYLLSIVIGKVYMRDREPFSLSGPLKLWNLVIGFVSGVCALGMTSEFFQTLFFDGINASVCSSGTTFFRGSNGFYAFLYHFIRVFEVIDTLFIVLRKQPLLFIHWYHHALTLVMAWYQYGRPSVFTRYVLYINAGIHAVMYTYYLLRAMRIRLPSFVAHAITSAQIVQFVIGFWSIIHPAVMKYFLQMPCELDDGVFAFCLFTDLCYLYLFIEFYRNKYNVAEKKEKKEKKFE